MGQRGPKPLPANVHLLRGNPSKLSASQLREDFQAPVEIPDCPPHLQTEARREWKRITELLEQYGGVSQLDRSALSRYCSAWSEWLFCEKQIKTLNKADPAGIAGLVSSAPSGYVQQSIWVQLRNNAESRMKKVEDDFAMNWASRSRVRPSDNRQGSLFVEGKTGQAGEDEWNNV